MNIMYITHETDLNGASRSLLGLIDCLENEHTIYVVVQSNKGKLVEELKKRKVLILVYPYYRWSVAYISVKNWLKKLGKWYFYEQFINIRTAKKMARIVNEQQIDIIHSNSGVINVGGLISKYTGVKHVWHLREFGDLDFNMHHLYPRIFYRMFMNKYAVKFICISKAIFDHYEYLETTKKTLIYNGVGKENYICNKKCIDDTEIKFLIAGRLEAAKGQYLAIQACQYIIEKGITNFKLYLAGSGSIDIPDDVKEYIHVIGMVEDMPKLRSGIDVELVCSKAEAFGRVTVEAMMSKCPVIGSDSGGTKELIQDGVTGYLFKCGDSVDLADKMIKIIENKYLINEFGEVASEYAIKGFGIDICAMNVCKLYEGL